MKIGMNEWSKLELILSEFELLAEAPRLYKLNSAGHWWAMFSAPVKYSRHHAEPTGHQDEDIYRISE